MGKVIGGKFSQIADIAEKNEKKKTIDALKEQERNPINEKPYGGTLNRLGRMACRKVVFEGISPEDFSLPKIGNIEDITKTKNFIDGYNSEMLRIKHALENNYLETVKKDYLSDIGEEKENKKTR